MSKEKIKIIVLKESFLDSVLSDIITIGLLLLAFYINERFVNGSNLCGGIIAIMFTIFVFGKSAGKGKHFNNKYDAMKAIKEWDEK